MVPFDDRDITKMIKAQLESRIDFPDTVMANVDHHVVNLLYEMLEPDTLKRANIERVLKHPWTRGNDR